MRNPRSFYGTRPYKQVKLVSEQDNFLPKADPLDQGHKVSQQYKVYNFPLKKNGKVFVFSEKRTIIHEQ